MSDKEFFAGTYMEHVIQCAKHGEHSHTIVCTVEGHEGAWCQLCWIETLGAPLKCVHKRKIKAIEIKAKKEYGGLEESIVFNFLPDISPKQADCFFKELSEFRGKYSLHVYSKRLFVVFHDQESRIVNEIKSSRGIIEIKTTFRDCIDTYSQFLKY